MQINWFNPEEKTNVLLLGTKIDMFENKYFWKKNWWAIKSLDSYILNSARKSNINFISKNIELKADNIKKLTYKIKKSISYKIKKIPETENIFIWISVYDQTINLSENIAKYIKNIRQNVILIAWWPSLNKYDSDVVSHLLWNWFDLLNIWWWKEFIEGLNSLWKWDLPKNIISENKVTNEWTHLVRTPNILWIKDKKPIIDLHLGWKCRNACDFCQVSKQTFFWWLDVEELKNYLDIVFNHFKEKSIIIIEEPNPMQISWNLTNKISEIWFEKIDSIQMFWDIYQLSRDSYIDELLELCKNNKINNISFWRDSIKRKWDGDLLWKKIWNRLYNEQEYKKIKSNLEKLLKKIKKNKIDLKIELNYIFHPFMEDEIFLEKINDINKFAKYNCKVQTHILSPYSWTEIKNKYKSNLICFEEFWEKKVAELIEFEELFNFFWNSFENSDTLNAYSIARLALSYDFNFIDLFVELLNIKLSKFENIKIFPKNKIEEFRELIKDKWLFPIFMYFINKIIVDDLDRDKIDDTVKEKVKEFIYELNSIIDLINHKETIIKAKNPAYKEIYYTKLKIKWIN